METWIAIDEFPDYSVSSEGRIKNNKTNKIKKPILNKRNGYYQTVLSYGDEGHRKKKTVRYHKYIAKYFCSQDGDNLEVNHIDGDKSNNHPSNLEYVTSSYNQKHAYKLGLRDNSGQIAMANATKKRCKVVDKLTGEVYEFCSWKEAGFHFGKSKSWVGDVIKKSKGETDRFIVKEADLKGE